MMRINEIQSILEPTVQAFGYVLWGVEWDNVGQGILRLYIDHPEGITVDDCEKVSRQVSGILDVQDFIPEAYRLEVSSPGVDRTLFTPAQFSMFMGSVVQVKIKQSQEGRSKFKGVLKEATPEFIRLELSPEEELKIAHRDIKAAKLVPVFEKGGLK